MRRIIKIMLVFMLPVLAYGQIGYRKADSALVTTDNGQIRVFKNQEYYKNAFSAVKGRTDSLLYLRVNSITPNIFKGLGYSDTKKIQLALDSAIKVNKPLVIAKNDDRDSHLWLLDSAVLLSSNSNIIIQNAKVKLSDQSRDNVFRSANCGLGISNPQDNPITNISIIGIGDAIIEGADNPRSTGDVGKTLKLVTQATGNNNTYGSDSGVSGQSQLGDWRNVGILLGYTSGIKITDLTLDNLHSYGISMERCSGGLIENIILSNQRRRIINGVTQYIKNADGIDMRYGTHDITVDNITGQSGDDPVALTILTNLTSTAGTLLAYNVTGDTFLPEIDNGYNIAISNVTAFSYANIIRILNTGASKVYNVNIQNITDSSIASDLYMPMTGSAVLFGSNNPIYGGATPIGNCSNITVNNVKSFNMPFNVNVQGSVSESSITNIYKKYTDTVNAPIFFASSSAGSRNLYTANIFEYGVNNDLIAVLDGDTGQKSGVSKNSVGDLILTDKATRGLQLAADYSSNFVDLSLVNKKWVNDTKFNKPTGTTAQYINGVGNTIDFGSQVRQSPVNVGAIVPVNTPLATGDNIAAFGNKTQGQINNLIDTKSPLNGGSGYIQNLQSFPTPQIANYSFNGIGYIGDGSIDFSTYNNVSGSTVSTRAKSIIAVTTNPLDTVNNHSFSDNSNFYNNNNNRGHNSYDYRINITGSGNNNHTAGFQDGAIYSSTGTQNYMYGFFSSPIIASGTINNRRGFNVADIISSGGSVINNIGLYIANLENGVNNWSIYSGIAPSRFTGEINLANISGTAGSGQVLRFTSGSAFTPEASISHEIINSVTGNLKFKVRKNNISGDAGLVDILSLNGGPNSNVVITGKASVSSAPTDPTDVVRKVELDAANGSIPIILSGSSTLDFPDTFNGNYSDLDITVSGALTSDVVSLGLPPTVVSSNCYFYAFVVSANTVRIRFSNNNTSGSIDPVSAVFKIKILK